MTAGRWGHRLAHPRIALAARLVFAMSSWAVSVRAGAPPAALSLADAVRIATGETPAVQLASLRTDEAQARVGQSRADLLPSLTGTADASNRTYNVKSFGFSFPSVPGAPEIPDLVGPVDEVDARVRVTQSLVDLAAWQRVKAAHHEAQQSAADQSTVVQTAAQDAAVAYLRAARAASLVTARQADADLASQLLELAEAQVQSGVSPEIDRTRARTALAVAQGQQILAARGLERAQIDLARTLGLDPDARFALTDTLGADAVSSDTPADSSATLTLALQRRAELRAEQSRYERAQAEHKALSAERIPRLEVEGDWGVNGPSASEAIPTRQVAVAVTLPLVDGFRREASMAEQDAVMREAKVRLRDLQHEIAAEVDGAMIDVANGLGLQTVAEEALGLAEVEVEQARDRFLNGIATNLELIQAQTSLLRARDADIDARYATAVARVNLARAAGVADTIH